MDNIDSAKPSTNTSLDNKDEVARTDEKKSEPGKNKTNVFSRLVNTGFFVAARRRFGFEWWGVVIVLLVLVLVGFRVYSRGRQANAGLLGRPLRVGIVPWPGYAGGLVANQGLKPNKDCAFWRNRNLYVEFVIENDAKKLQDAFILGGAKGGVDVMWSTVDSLAQQFPEFSKANVRPRAFMQVDWSRGGDAIVARGGIDHVGHLAGKTIAVSMAASQWLLEYTLESLDLGLTDLQKTQIRQSSRIKTEGSREALNLFINNKVDAAVLWEPDVSEAKEKRPGAQVLVSSADADYLIADVMIAKEDFIKENPEVINAFINGWLDGTKDAINNPMLAVKVLMDEPDLGFHDFGEEKTRELLGKTALATLEDNVEMFGLSGSDPFFDGIFNRASRMWMKKGYITEPASAANLRDSSFLKKIWDVEQEKIVKLSCEKDLPTVELAIRFAPNKAELSAEAQRSLDDRDIALLLRTNSQFRFCVEATTNDGEDPQLSQETKRMRERGVINYLVEQHKRPPNQFLSASTNAQTFGNGKYIRLKLVGPSDAIK